MTIGIFDPGDKVFLDWTFTKAEGQTGTPATVTVVITVIDPLGGVYTPAASSAVTLGVVTAHATITLPRDNDVAGAPWRVIWDLTGDIIAHEEETFWMRASPALALLDVLSV
jgi:hypothetical protein